MKTILLLMASAMTLLLPLSAVLAQETSHSEDDFASAKALIDAETPCDELSDEQLERIGDYIMEQMHAGEQHELMDQMMGGDGSESLRQAHIFMARRWYCGDAVGMGMMSMMMPRIREGYAGMGMMGNRTMNMMDGQSYGKEYGAWNHWNTMVSIGGLHLASLWVTHLLLWIFLATGSWAFIMYARKK